MRRLILLTLLLYGCSTQHYWNHAVSFRYQPEHYNYDLATCQRIAAANAPIPPIHIEYNGPRYVYGTADITGGGIAQQVRYSGYIYEAPTFSSGFAQGWQIGSAIAAAENQSRIVKNCMSRSGWVETAENYTPRHGNRQIPENRLVLDRVDQGFVDMLKGSDGWLYLWNPSVSYIDESGAWEVSIADIRLNNSSFICTHGGRGSGPQTAVVICEDGSRAQYSFNPESIVGTYLQKLRSR